MLAKGPLVALLSATLFGISPALTKLVMGVMSPVLLAGLLYLGSGLGLQIILMVQKKPVWNEIRRLQPRSQLKLLAAIVFGGILAPVLLTAGIRLASAFEVSLLLNLEAVATTLIASLLFHEHVSKHVWIGKGFVLIGAAILALQGSFHISLAALLVVAACICWGFDNNFTRDVEHLPAVVLASVKGWVAGSFNILLAVFLGQYQASPIQVAGSLTIGLFSYGLSLVLFIHALRLIGAARTSTYFATGPFVGMIFALLFLGENPPLHHWIASLFMAAGIWILFHERHSHNHSHRLQTHKHKHVHDEHHRHSHNGTEGPEPHDHVHTHEPISHSHPHWPDIHHRHSH